MGIEIVGSVGPLEGKHQHTAPMSEAILKKLEKEAVASVAVAEALQGHAVQAILARSGDRRRRGVVRTILEQQVFINEVMEVGLDLALARWNRGPKAEEFFTRMKDDILDGREDLRVSLENVGTSWAEVKSSTAAIPACQAYASAFVHLFATQPDAHCAICSLINFKLWNEMCKTVLAAAPKDSGPYIERFAKRAGDQMQVDSFRKRALAAADESGEALSSFKDLVDFASIIQHAELAFFDGLVPSEQTIRAYHAI